MNTEQEFVDPTVEQQDFQKVLQRPKIEGSQLPSLPSMDCDIQLDSRKLQQKDLDP